MQATIENGGGAIFSVRFGDVNCAELQFLDMGYIIRKISQAISSQSALFYFVTVFAEPQISAECYILRRTDFFKLDIGLFTVIEGIMAVLLIPLLLCYEL